MKRLLHATLILAVTAVLLVLFARGANLTDVWHQILGADPTLLAMAFATASAAYLLRAKRWQFLLRPVGSTRYSSALRATVIGFAASFLLPGRAGEVLRPYLLAREERLSAVAAFATIVVERLLDMIGVLLLFAAFLCFAHPQAAITDPSLFRAVQIGGVLAGAASLVGFVMLALIARHPDRAERTIGRVAAMLPRMLGDRLTGLARTFMDGLAILKNPADAALALAGAFPLWLCSAATIWFVSEAFQLGIPPSGSLLLLVLLVIGISVPTPGGAGGVHYAFRLGATALYAASEDRAVGAAIVFHALLVVPVSVAGVALAFAEGLSLRRLRGIAAADSARPSLPSRLGTAESA